MAKLIYITNVTLDGYIEDAHGNFDWTEPSDEVFRVHYRSPQLRRHLRLRPSFVRGHGPLGDGPRTGCAVGAQE